jgi:hypothetical protein
MPQSVDLFVIVQRTVLLAALALTAVGCGDDAGSAEPDAGPTVDPDVAALIGTWVRAQAAQSIEFRFDADGSYVQELFPAGSTTPQTTTEGTWSIDQKVLSLVAGGTQVETPLYVDGTTFSRDQVYLRMSLTPGVVGTWEMVARTSMADAEGVFVTDKTRTDKLVFFDDGTFEYTSEQRSANGQPVGGTQDIQRAGTYTVDGDEITTADAVEVRVLVMADGRLWDTAPIWTYEREQ